MNVIKRLTIDPVAPETPVRDAGYCFYIRSFLLLELLARRHSQKRRFRSKLALSTTIKCALAVLSAMMDRVTTALNLSN